MFMSTIFDKKADFFARYEVFYKKERDSVKEHKDTHMWRGITKKFRTWQT